LLHFPLNDCGLKFLGVAPPPERAIGVAQAPKMRPGGFQLLDDSQQVADRSRQTIEPVSILLRNFS
jgi:hypothetical protein